MKRLDVIQALNAAIQDKLNSLKAEMSDLKNDLAADTKNTSGDKHETSRAMNQLEQERIGKQLEQSEAMLISLKALRGVDTKTQVVAGQLLRVNGSYYFLSIAFGKLTVENEIVFVLSPASPIGEQLIGKSIGDKIQFNGNELLIEAIID